MGTTIHPTLKRHISYLFVHRHGQFGADEAPPIPLLWQPELLTFMSDRAMMLAGFEEIDGQRYYQGWWLQTQPERAARDPTPGHAPTGRWVGADGLPFLALQAALV